jgi:hypothetical protein
MRRILIIFLLMSCGVAFAQTKTQSKIDSLQQIVKAQTDNAVQSVQAIDQEITNSLAQERQLDEHVKELYQRRDAIIRLATGKPAIEPKK